MREGRAQALVGGLALLGIAVTAAALYAGRTKRTPQPRRSYDYSARSGFPRPAAEMRGAARTATRRPSAASFASPASVPAA